MPRVLVSGLINLETTLRVDGFPVDYFPVRYPFYGVSSSVSGVGYNVARALSCLGDELAFLSLIGQDPAGEIVQNSLRRDGLPAENVLPRLHETPQSVILYDGQGRRQIHVDLKDIQEQHYPPEAFERALAGCQAAALCNINFSRPFLARARQAGKLIATDVHALSSLDDEYNREFIQAADILFMSHENLPTSPEDFAHEVVRRFATPILVIGLGSQGALLYVERKGLLERFPAVATRPIVNTIGAGDALFSAFLHAYLQAGDPRAALRRAMLFASWKIGENGAANGFLDADGLEELERKK